MAMKIHVQILDAFGTIAAEGDLAPCEGYKIDLFAETVLLPYEARMLIPGLARDERCGVQVKVALQ